MVKIRLFRTGTKRRPSYRIVAVDSRRKRQGRVLEILGTYEPRRGGAFQFRQDALDRWVSLGAQLTETVQSLVRRARRERTEEGGPEPKAEEAPAS